MPESLVTFGRRADDRVGVLVRVVRFKVETGNVGGVRRGTAHKPRSCVALGEHVGDFWSKPRTHHFRAPALDPRVELAG